MIGKFALLLGATLLVSILRRRVGGGLGRNLVMFGGTLGGIALGALVATLASPVVHVEHVDLLDVCLFTGIFAGWALAWPIARRFPPA